MNLAKIYALAKAYKSVEIIEANGTQWLTLVFASYALRGFPRLTTKAEVLAMLGVPAEDAENWSVKLPTQSVPWSFFRPLDPDEDPLRPLPVGLKLAGDALDIYADGSMVKSKFCAPVEFDRVTDDGIRLRLFRGAQLEAVVAKFRPTPDQIDSVIPLLERMQALRDQEYAEKRINMEDDDGNDTSE